MENVFGVMNDWIHLATADGSLVHVPKDMTMSYCKNQCATNLQSPDVVAGADVSFHVDASSKEDISFNSPRGLCIDHH